MKLNNLKTILCLLAFTNFLGLHQAKADEPKNIPGVTVTGKKGGCPENSICDEMAIQALIDQLSQQAPVMDSGRGGGGGKPSSPNIQDKEDDSKAEQKWRNVVREGPIPEGWSKVEGAPTVRCPCFLIERKK